MTCHQSVCVTAVFLLQILLPSLKLTAKAPEKKWLEYVGILLSYWVSAYFQGRAVSFREGKFPKFTQYSQESSPKSSTSTVDVLDVRIINIESEFTK